MALERWDPFRDLRKMEYTVDRLWRGFGPRTYATTPEAESWGIPLDVVRDGDNIVVSGSLPGVKPEDIKVTIEDDVLTVSGTTETEQETAEGTYLLRERRAGAFHRALRLPDSVDSDKAETSYTAGVLTITLPKLEEKKAKQLTIKVEGGNALAEK
jgi:HSP20 family protein